jgi:uncharacterized protein
MALVTFLFFYLVMFLTAALFSALGLGGGTLYVPIQIFFGIDFHVAVATSLFLILITSLSSTLVFRKSRAVDWAMALVLETATTLGSFLGGFYSGHFTGRLLTYLFAVVIAFTAFLMLRDFRLKPKGVRETPRSYFLWNRQPASETYCINLAIALPLSFLAGGLSGLLGLGGGILKVPMMVLLFGVPMNIAIGSSAFMVGITASGGLLGHLMAGHFSWKVAFALAPAIFLGGQIGARKSIKVDKHNMRIYFGYFLFALAVFLMIHATLS